MSPPTELENAEEKLNEAIVELRKELSESEVRRMAEQALNEARK